MFPGKIHSNVGQWISIFFCSATVLQGLRVGPLSFLSFPGLIDPNWGQPVPVVMFVLKVLTKELSKTKRLKG